MATRKTRKKNNRSSQMAALFCVVFVVVVVFFCVFNNPKPKVTKTAETKSNLPEQRNENNAKDASYSATDKAYLNDLIGSKKSQDK